MKNSNWWKEAVVYQIYPKSFKDSNGDGIGDILGIVDELDYLQNLGVSVIWTTPMYRSPQRDNRYNISDYYNIYPLFGTMEEFEVLLQNVHKHGMKLIMDMVVNHTSTDHEWFKQALQGPDNPYYDFYIWKDGVDGNPPNNWASKFGGSAWEYVEHLDKYYLHLFDVTQADLNWENPKLREEIYKMMCFWMDKGVDGFRLDVINLLSKDQSFPNDTFETPTMDGRRFYTDGPKIHEYLQEMNREVFSRYDKTMTVGEMSSTTIDHCINYTNPTRQELTMTFSFHHLKVDYPNGEKWALAPLDFMKLKGILFDWQIGMQEGDGWNALFWCNHDQPRVLSRFGDDTKYHNRSGKMLGTAIHLMRGTPYVYQGEEIGMTNPKFEDISKYRDVESINAYRILLDKGYSQNEVIKILQSKSRDNSRTPMQWDNSENSGFSKGSPWIDVAYNYNVINARKSEEDKDFIYNYYKELIDLRKKYTIISDGKFEPILKDHHSVLGYIRSYNNQKLLVLCNFYDTDTKVTLPQGIVNDNYKFLISNTDTNVLNKEMTLKPYEAFAVLIEG